MEKTKDYNSKEKMYDIMNITQSNYSNMLKRLDGKKNFSNFVITYYSIALIVYSLTGEFFPEYFNVRLSSYFNIILSVVVLVYSLIASNAKYSERARAAERILNAVKTKKRELDDGDVTKKREEYEKIMMGAEYRSELDFFKTLKQRCRENDIRWYLYKKDIKKIKEDDKRYDEAQKLNNYLSENFPISQEARIIFLRIWEGIIILVPAILFLVCFMVEFALRNV